MRLSRTLDLDVVAAVEHLRETEGIGLSEAVNGLIRQGLVGRDTRAAFVQATSPVGIMIDVSNVHEALNLIDGPLRQ